MQPAKVPIDPSSFKGLIVQQNDWKTNSIKTRVKKLVKGDQRKNGKGREGTMTWWKKEKKIGWKRAQSTLVDISEAAYTFSAGLRPSGATRHMHLGVRDPVPSPSCPSHICAATWGRVSMEQVAYCIKYASPFPLHAHSSMEKSCQCLTTVCRGGKGGLFWWCKWLAPSKNASPSPPALLVPVWRTAFQPRQTPLLCLLDSLALDSFLPALLYRYFDRRMGRQPEAKSTFKLELKCAKTEKRI